MVVSPQNGVSVPLFRPEVRRDFYRNALTFRRVLPVRGGDHDEVHVDHVLRPTVCFAAVATLRIPLSELHQPSRESYNGRFANGGVFTRRVDVEKKTAVARQVFSVPSFRHRRFLIQFLLKLLKASEGHERGSPSRAEVVLGDILERMGGIVLINWRIGNFAAGGTVVVYWVVLRDTRKR